MHKSSGISLVLFLLLIVGLGSGCEAPPEVPGLGELDASTKPASRYTRDANAALLSALPFDDRGDFDDATRGYIASVDGAVARGKEGGLIYGLEDMAFLEGDAPDTVNPSLWRQAQLNALLHGLFEVEEGIYQLRSMDLANMTLIEGDSGWIVVDPLTSSETAANALALANRELGERPVRAVIFTHSHIDHFGGVSGIVDAEQVRSGEVKLIAPVGFEAEAFSENLRAGNVMQRRAAYQFGSLLGNSATGFVSTGLGNKVARGAGHGATDSAQSHHPSCRQRPCDRWH